MPIGCDHVTSVTIGGGRCLEGMTQHMQPDDPGAATATETKSSCIGGGYSGTLAANHLTDARHGHSTSRWSTPAPKFVERIRLHQHVAGNYDATVDYGSLLGEGIKLVVDTATRIDTANRTVELASGVHWATTTSSTRSAAPAQCPLRCPAPPNSPIPIAEFEQAQRLRDAIDRSAS